MKVIGASPRPPWAIRQEIPDSLKADIREVVVTIHRDSQPRLTLAAGLVDCIPALEDEDDDPIREIQEKAPDVSLTGALPASG